MPKRNPDAADDPCSPEAETSSRKRAKVQGEDRKSVCFDGVTLFYFERSQGCSTIPNRGGTTLGMSPTHHEVRQMSLEGHALEMKELRRSQMLRMLSVECNARKRIAADAGVSDEQQTDSPESSVDDEEDDAELDAPIGNDEFEGDEPVDYDFFLQPLGSKQRKHLLLCSGVTDLDRGESEECRAIRRSRESCGCDCKTQCLPETCSCAKNEIKCQVDRFSFPCSCSRQSCSNPWGRVEFNPVRVRSHYFHTMMRLRMESEHGCPAELAVSSPTHIRFEPDTDSYCDETPVAPAAFCSANHLATTALWPAGYSGCGDEPNGILKHNAALPHQLSKVVDGCSADFSLHAQNSLALISQVSSADFGSSQPMPHFESLFGNTDLAALTDSVTNQIDSHGGVGCCPKQMDFAAGSSLCTTATNFDDIGTGSHLSYEQFMRYIYDNSSTAATSSSSPNKLASGLDESGLRHNAGDSCAHECSYFDSSSGLMSSEDTSQYFLHSLDRTDATATLQAELPNGETSAASAKLNGLSSDSSLDSGFEDQLATSAATYSLTQLYPHHQRSSAQTTLMSVDNIANEHSIVGGCAPELAF